MFTMNEKLEIVLNGETYKYFMASCAGDRESLTVYNTKGRFFTTVKWIEDEPIESTFNRLANQMEKKIKRAK